MIKAIQKLKNKKGFTLVELIVVLVILAILAAMLVPALTGYIDKANKQAIIAETRQVVMAAQATLSEDYASSSYKADTWVGNINTADSDLQVEVLKLAEMTDKGDISGVTVKDGKITTLTWTNDNKNKCTYTASPADGKEMYS